MPNVLDDPNTLLAHQGVQDPRTGKRYYGDPWESPPAYMKPLIRQWQAAIRANPNTTVGQYTTATQRAVTDPRTGRRVYGDPWERGIGGNARRGTAKGQAAAAPAAQQAAAPAAQQAAAPSADAMEAALVQDANTASPQDQGGAGTAQNPTARRPVTGPIDPYRRRPAPPADYSGVASFLARGARAVPGAAQALMGAAQRVAQPFIANAQATPQGRELLGQLAAYFAAPPAITPEPPPPVARAYAPPAPRMAAVDPNATGYAPLLRTDYAMQRAANPGMMPAQGRLYEPNAFPALANSIPIMPTRAPF